MSTHSGPSVSYGAALEPPRRIAGLAWAPDTVDPARTKRLSAGITVGLGVLVVMGSAAWRMQGAAPPPEESLDVKLVASAPEAEKEPPPPPPPPPPPEQKPLVLPKTAPPPPATPSPPEPAGDGPGKLGEEGAPPAHSGNGAGPGTGAAPPPPPPTTEAPPPPPPPPAPKPQGPVQLPEDGVAPVALSNPAPGVPEEARKQGIEATVVVKFVVTEGGSVTNVTVVRGHPLLDEAVVAIVKTWKYKPALVDGKPTAVYRTAKFPFRLKTE